MLDQLDQRLRYLVATASLVVIAAGIKAAHGPLNSLLFAGLVTVAVMPVFAGLRRRGWSTGLAVGVTASMMLGIILGLVGILGLAATNLVRVVPMYEGRVQALWLSVTAQLEQRGIDLSRLTSGDTLQPGKVLDFVAGILSSIGSALSTSLLLLIIVAFILAEMAARRSDLHPAGLLGEVVSDVRQYLGITTATGAGFAAAVYLLLLAVGTDLAFVWAVFAFVMNFVPNVGIILTFIPPTLLTLLEYGWQRAVVVLVGIILMNFAVDNLVKPRFMRSGLAISELTGLVSLIVWSFLLGAPGALLAIPLTLALRRLLETPAIDPPTSLPAEDETVG